ncbi:MAG: hypothetical protein WCI67_12410 [Chloroflexales bacterium]
MAHPYGCFMDEGRFTIPTRVYLTAAQREKLDGLLRIAEQDLDVLLSDLLAGYLAGQADPSVEPGPDLGAARAAELAGRRRELRRLRAKLNDPYNPPPPWLITLVADLEAEIARLARE